MQPPAGTRSSASRERSRSRELVLSTIHVRVNNLAGEIVGDFDLHPEAHAEDVKVRLQPLTGWRASDQQLALNDQRLESDQPLQGLCTQVSRRSWLELTVLNVPAMLALTGWEDGTIRLWNLDDSSDLPLTVLKGHSKAVQGLEVDWKSQRALSGASGDPCLCLWDLRTGSRVHRFEGHSEEIYGMLVDFATDSALSWGGDCTLRLWALITGEEVQCFKGHATPVGDAEVDWEGRHALSWPLECNGAAVLWDLDTGVAKVNCFVGSWQDSLEVEAHWDSWRALCISDCQEPLLLDLKSGLPLLRLASATSGASEGMLTAAKVDWDSGYALAWGSSQEMLTVWHLESRSCTKKLEGHEEGIHGAETNLEDACAVSWGADHAIWYWNWTEPSNLKAKKLGHHDDSIGGIDVDWSSGMALSWSDDKTLQVFELEAQKAEESRRRILTGHESPVWSASVNWSSRRAISYGFLDQVVLVWNLDEGKAEHMLRWGSALPWAGGVEVHWEQSRAMVWCCCDVLPGVVAPRLCVWDLESNAKMKSFEAPAVRPRCAVLRG